MSNKGISALFVDDRRKAKRRNYEIPFKNVYLHGLVRDKDGNILKDVNGKMFFAEFVNVAKDKGEGWVDYMWPKPGDKTPVPKVTYVYKVPDFPVAVAAGIYE